MYFSGAKRHKYFVMVHQHVHPLLCAACPTTGEPQVVPGTIGLVYDPQELAEVVSRLKSATVKVNAGGDGGDHALEGTKFAWRETGDGDEEEGDIVEVVCPYGTRVGQRVGGAPISDSAVERCSATRSDNHPHFFLRSFSQSSTVLPRRKLGLRVENNRFLFRLSTGTRCVEASSVGATAAVDQLNPCPFWPPQPTSHSPQGRRFVTSRIHSRSRSGNVYRLSKRKSSSASRDQRGDFDPRGGRLPNTPVAEHQSPSARGLGVAHVSFRVRPETAGGIARFYREVFGAEVEEIGGSGGGGSGDGNCATEGGSSAGEMSCSATVRGQRLVGVYFVVDSFFCACGYG